MPFKKGHVPDPEWGKRAGRKTGNRNRKGEKNNQTLDKYNFTKEWVKRASKKCENIDDINHYIYNDIPLEEYYKKHEK